MARPVTLFTGQWADLTLDDYLTRNPTTGLLIARGDRILVERYQYGRTDRDRLTSWSMAKTVTAMLVGIAIVSLYFLLPSLLLGATFAVGGKVLGLEASAGTDDLAGFIFLGTVVGGLVGAAFWDIAFSFKREMDAGPLEPAWLTPTRAETLVLGRAFSAIAIGGSATVVLPFMVALRRHPRRRRPSWRRTGNRNQIVRRSRPPTG